MKFGMNLTLWTDRVGAEHRTLFEKIQTMGYDGVEFYISPQPEDDNLSGYQKLGRQLDDCGLSRTAVTVCTAETDPISPDPTIRAKSVEYLQKVLDCCETAGVEQLVGPFHSALRKFSGRAPTNDEWKRSVECMRQVAQHAESRGVTLAVECLNRYECYFLTCHADTARFAREVDHPRFRMMYDTFHANIEEKSVSEAIKSCGDVLVHVHVSENDRSTPGHGSIDWTATFDTLKSIDYDGWIVVETFGQTLPHIVEAANIWRKAFDSEEQLARDSLAFLRQQVEARW